MNLFKNLTQKEIKEILGRISSWEPTEEDRLSIQAAVLKAEKLIEMQRSLENITWAEINTPYTV